MGKFLGVIHHKHAHDVALSPLIRQTPLTEPLRTTVRVAK